MFWRPLTSTASGALRAKKSPRRIRCHACATMPSLEGGALGRREKCTAEAIERAVELKGRGVNDVDVARCIGVRADTLSKWRNDPKTDNQRRMAEALDQAEGDYKAALLGIIMRDAQERDWKAAAWLLERKYPNEYGKAQRVVADTSEQDADRAAKDFVEALGLR